MNKRAVELSITQLIGFVIVAVIFLGTIGLVMKIVGIMAEKPDEATLNSFENLVHELETIEDGQTKEVPYYIGESFYLFDEKCSAMPVEEDICICSSDNCKKVLQKHYFEKGRFIDVPAEIRGEISGKERGVKNVIIRKVGEVVTVTDT
ncbi:MAG: hypothetical protein KJ601_01065 [Nanoarchaeota archaeon]|nr:hypothetical protein [Nanoarchaeota archaeon]